MNLPASKHDVAIIGGGLAGLTLALQLRARYPEMDVALLERCRYPVPETVHKIGESTVELGAHYLADVIGLRDHLDQQQLRKFGLRFYFGLHNGAIEDADELGVSRVFSTPTWQVDRGVLENELASRAVAAGVRIIDGAVARTIQFNGVSRVEYQSDSNRCALEARWLIDAASRASPLRRQLGLARSNEHDVNANWFRVEGEIRIEQWSSETAWGARTGGVPRWLSTNQFMGQGYWVWVIPLPTGATSIGIVADPACHPLDQINTLERALAWLRRHQPRLAAALEGHKVLDFGFLRHFSHDCSELFSPDRWALTGEAGLFIDPLYSPGTDFIAIGNSFIADLVGRDLAGENISRRSRALESIFRSLYSNSLSVYQGHYPGFGDSRLMVLKTTWDYCYYWSVLASLYVSGHMARLVDDAALRNRLLVAVTLNQAMQRRFREAHSTAPPRAASGLFYDQAGVPLMRRLNRQLGDRLDGAAFSKRIDNNVAELELLSACLVRRLEQPAAAALGGEHELLGLFSELLNE